MRLRAFWIVPLALAVVLAEGCDSGKGALDAAGGVQVLDPRAERPAPGTLRALPPEPIELESIWAWKDVWVSLADLAWCTLDTFGFEKSRGAKAARQFTVDDVDNHFVLTFGSTAVEADQCAGFRVQLPNSEHAGFWWARGGDLNAESYPFSPERFAAMAKVEPGLFEVDTAAVGPQGNWSGHVRLIRIDPYGNPGETIELHKVEARCHRAFGGAKAPPVKAEVKPDTASKCAALMMRAHVTQSLDDMGLAASFCFREPHDAPALARLALKSQARDRARELLESGDSREALRAFSIAAQGSGNPVDFLYELLDELSPEQRKLLWPEDPYLVIESFENAKGQPFHPWREKSGRTTLKNEVASRVALVGTSSAHLQLSDPTSDEVSWHTLLVWIPFSQRPFSLRFWIRESHPSSTKCSVLVGLRDEDNGFHYFTLRRGIEAGEQQGLWQQFDVETDISAALAKHNAQRGGEQMADNLLRVIIGIRPEGGANDFWLDSVELCTSTQAGG